MVLGNPFGRGLRQALARDPQQPFQEVAIKPVPLGLGGPLGPPPAIPKFKSNDFRAELRSSLDLSAFVMNIDSDLSSNRLDDDATAEFREQLVEALIAAQGHPSLATEFARPRRRMNQILVRLMDDDPSFSQTMKTRAPEIVDALRSSTPSKGQDRGLGFGD